jgi:hypothetical protein
MIGHGRERIDLEIGPDQALEIGWPELAGPYQCAAQSRALCTVDVADDVVADHHRVLGPRAEQVERGREEVARGFAEYDGFAAGRIFERLDERTDVELQASGRAPVTRQTERDATRALGPHQHAKSGIQTLERPLGGQVADHDAADRGNLS